MNCFKVKYLCQRYKYFLFGGHIAIFVVICWRNHLIDALFFELSVVVCSRLFCCWDVCGLLSVIASTGVFPVSAGISNSGCRSLLQSHIGTVVSSSSPLSETWVSRCNFDKIQVFPSSSKLVGMTVFLDF